jgi:hypothetical protein
MAFNEFETKRIKQVMDKFIERVRPSVEIRDKLDISYRIEGSSVLIIEIRPDFRDPKTKRDIPVAKTTFVKTTKSWKVFWQRADMNWHGYDPNPEVHSLEEFLEIVDEDKHGCFWG